MPRVGQVKPVDDERLTDRIAVGVLTSMFPPALVDEVLEATGRVEKRHRLLPARVVVYFTLAMCLWADEGYEEVARLLVGGLGKMARCRVPTTGALTQPGTRLGQRTRRRHPTPGHLPKTPDQEPGDFLVAFIGPQAHRQREIHHHPRRQQPVTLLHPTRRLEHLIDQRRREHRGQHPHRDPIRKTLIIDRLDLTNSWHETTLQSPTLTKWYCP